MAARKKRKRGKPSPTVFEACSGSGCEITHRAARVSRVAFYPGFSYTTPSAINEASPVKKRSRAERREMGCRFEQIAYKTKKGVKKTKTIVADTRAECQDPGIPCPTKRQTCPVQLIFRRGQAMLRFCQQQKKAGYVIGVSSAKEAQKRAAAICKCWDDNGRSFDGCLPANTPLGGIDD